LTRTLETPLVVDAVVAVVKANGEAKALAGLPRMPERHDLSARAEDRRPKAPRKESAAALGTGY
jgi:hypothetical protein